MNLLALIWVLLMITGTISTNPPESLKLVQIVQRHGDRTPTNFYPKDPLKDPKHWPQGIGELTNNGRQRMYEFGVSLRQRYGTYLGQSPRDVSVKSSSSSRCLESAQSFMTGLYKPDGQWIWDNNSVLASNWQPIAIASDDRLLRTSADCPKADQLWTEFMKTDKEVIDYINANKKFMVWLGNQTGDNYVDSKPSPLRPLEFLSTTLRVEKECGYDIPDWADQPTRDTLRDLEKHAFYFDWKSPQIQRLRAGPLLQELVLNMVNRADEVLNTTKTAKTKRLYVYETHDVSQVVTMQALAVYESVKVNRTPPKYTGSLIFELHQSGDHFVVKLLYFDDIGLKPTDGQNFTELQLVNCSPDSDCTLEEFMKSVDDYIPEDWPQECGNIDINDCGDNSYIYFNAFSLLYIVIGVLLASISVSVFRCLRNRRLTTHADKSETNSLHSSDHKSYNI